MTARDTTAVIEDLEWIIGTDHPEVIAARLGYADVDNLRVMLRRHGRYDLAARLDLREAA